MRMRTRLTGLALLVAVALILGLDRLTAQTTTALTGSTNISVQFTQDAALDLGSSRFPLALQYSQSWTTGVGANQVNRLFSDSRTITASSTEDLDLAGGLTDAFGQTLTFARVKAIVIKAAAANTNNVTVKPDGTAGFLGPFNAAADKIAIPPGGVVFMTAPSAAGWVVTATTADLLEIGNSGAGTSVVYEITIVGGAT